jgi:thymidylate synthase
MEPGALTVFSHSISIDVSSLEKARKIAESKESDEVYDPATGKHGPRMDSNGDFIATFDPETLEIKVQHAYNGMKLKEYRGKSAEEIERQLARDGALSDISHALYLGREIARKERDMQKFRAEKTK